MNTARNTGKARQDRKRIFVIRAFSGVNLSARRGEGKRASYDGVVHLSPAKFLKRIISWKYLASFASPMSRIHAWNSRSENDKRSLRHTVRRCHHEESTVTRSFPAFVLFFLPFPTVQSSARARVILYLTPTIAAWLGLAIATHASA
jgi:hypothetical protein